MLTINRRKIISFIRKPNLTGLKLVLTFLVSIITILFNNIYILVSLAICEVIILMLSGISWKQLRPFLTMSIFTALSVMLVHLFSKTMLLGVIVTLQIVIITFTSCFLVCTTNDLDIIYAVDGFLKPLKKLGINTEVLSFSLFLTVRSIRIIYSQYQQIFLAQKARGTHNNPLAIMAPLLIKLFRSADLITEALIARGALLVIQDELTINSREDNYEKLHDF